MNPLQEKHLDAINTIYDGKIWTIEAAAAITQITKEFAVGFAEWCMDNGWEKWPTDCMWQKYKDLSELIEDKTTSELFDLYIEHLESLKKTK